MRNNVSFPFAQNSIMCSHKLDYLFDVFSHESKSQKETFMDNPTQYSWDILFPMLAFL